MDDAGDLEEKPERHVNKVPLQTVGWKPEFFEQLQKHVVDVNQTTTHAYLLA
ncbi:hypothetical protein H4R99_006980, partial [Coemansia sp. RSA 1722]